MANRRQRKGGSGRTRKAWQREERRTCRAFGGVHDGRPGRPDCVLPDGRGLEVKRWRRPVRAADVVRVAAAPGYAAHPLAMVCARGAGGVTRGAVLAGWRIGVRVWTCDPEEQGRRPEGPR